MNKKKVIELINKAQLTSAKVNSKDNKDTLNLTILEAVLQQVESELKKPDWISVEDELPPYEEDVLVCNKEEPSYMWFGHRTSDRRVVVDEHEFAKGYGTITHWRRIDKLEV